MDAVAPARPAPAESIKQGGCTGRVAGTVGSVYERKQSRVGGICGLALVESDRPCQPARERGFDEVGERESAVEPVRRDSGRLGDLPHVACEVAERVPPEILAQQLTLR